MLAARGLSGAQTISAIRGLVARNLAARSRDDGELSVARAREFVVLARGMLLTPRTSRS